MGLGGMGGRAPSSELFLPPTKPLQVLPKGGGMGKSEGQRGKGNGKGWEEKEREMDGWTDRLMDVEMDR